LSALPLPDHSEALWKRALEAVGDSVWDWYVQSGVEIYSPGFLRLYGYEPGEIEDTPEALDRLTHPDDRAQMARDRADHFEGRTPVYRNEHRVLCKGGVYKWVLTRGLVIARDGQGRPLRMIGTHTDIDARKTGEEQAWHLASHDALTGLPNRRLFGERLAHELKRVRRDGQHLALLALDLDHFKAVNDRFGHDVGDSLLIEAALRIGACVREIDMVARLGGDEFVVLLCDLDAEPGVVERIARALVERLAQPYAQLAASTQLQQPSASLGIAFCPEDSADAEGLYRCADQALYAAKSAGRRSFRFHTPRLQRAAQAHGQLADELRRALAQQELRLRFRTVQCCGEACPQAEVLLRWQHPQLGELKPRSFLATAEAAGLVDAIGDWLLREVASCLRSWRGQAPTLQLSLRAAAGQLHRWSRNLPEWGARLRELGFEGGSSLLLDLNETQLRDPQLQGLLQRPALQAAGVRIALDDFGGTGSAAALSSLEHPGLSVVKLARERVLAINEPRGQAWLRCVTALAQAQGLRVMALAEQHQRKELLALGVDALLGPGVAAPLDREAFGHWLSSHSAVGNP
jgi:diguanylate cyclase (GGDEF)-like protein/PAS domain S-box-containing protein